MLVDLHLLLPLIIQVVSCRNYQVIQRHLKDESELTLQPPSPTYCDTTLLWGVVMIHSVTSLGIQVENHPPPILHALQLLPHHLKIHCKDLTQTKCWQYQLLVCHQIHQGHNLDFEVARGGCSHLYLLTQTSTGYGDQISLRSRSPFWSTFNSQILRKSLC